MILTSLILNTTQLLTRNDNITLKITDFQKAKWAGKYIGDQQLNPFPQSWLLTAAAQ